MDLDRDRGLVNQTLQVNCNISHAGIIKSGRGVSMLEPYALPSAWFSALGRWR
jgi:hypothetical protein